MLLLIKHKKAAMKVLLFTSCKSLFNAIYIDFAWIYKHFLEL